MKYFSPWEHLYLCWVYECMHEQNYHDVTGRHFQGNSRFLQKLIACVMTSQTTAQTTHRSQICTLVCVHEIGRTVISFCSDKSRFLTRWMCWVLTGNHNWLIGIYQTKSDTTAFPFSNSRCGFEKDWALMAKRQALVVECLDFSFPIQSCKYWAENGQQSQPSSW